MPDFTPANHWAAEMLAIADTYDRSGLAHCRALAAELREDARNAPDCEHAFRFRICMLLDMHPKQDRDVLDTYVERANARRTS